MRNFYSRLLVAFSALALFTLVGCDGPKVDISKSRIPGGGLGTSRPTKVPTAPPTGKPSDTPSADKKDEPKTGG